MLRLYTNFFQPVMKLIEKARTGSGGKVKKKYDRARTPYRKGAGVGYRSRTGKRGSPAGLRGAESGEAES